MVAKTKLVQVRTTPIQAAAWESAAARVGVSLAEWIRQCAARGCGWTDPSQIRVPNDFRGAFDEHEPA